MKERFLSKWDILLIAAVGILCTAAILWPRAEDGPLTAEVFVDGTLTHSILLDEVEEPYELSLATAPPARLRVERGRICYLSAECPDELCVRAGWLSRAGDTAACMPGRSMVVLRADGERIFQTY